jgi:hypothetical protein
MDEKLRLKLDECCSGGLLGFGVMYWPRKWVGEGLLHFLTHLVATVVAT